ncbi:MAG TPA: DUF2380 domain-containing protein [Myxococcus sp.]|nr:DUF2380 domain-containing protein [Myxococcus sp.]
MGGGPRKATQARQAVLEAVDEVKGSTARSTSALSQLAARPPGLGNVGLSGVNGAFTRYLDHGSHQLSWLRGAVGSATVLADAARDVDDPDMALALMRLAGPRLQAALSGALLVAAWVDFLQLADAVLRQFPAYSVERLFMDLYRLRQRTAPTLAALASQDPAQVEAAATAMPELMGELTREFGAIRDGARTAMERREKRMAAMQLVETLALISALKVSLPRLPPAAPATLGVGFVMGPGGVMAGSQLVVSAEWVEMMRRLVQAGVLSVPAVSAAVRIHGGQVLMAQANDELPKGVREALGDGPEVRGMHETGRAGAGMAEPPKHHVLPQEHRAWFEQRGFKGDMDIDRFCVRLEPAHHQAIHGGGDWRLGRTWPNEWNQRIMRTLNKSERELGRTLTRNEVLNIVAESMKEYWIPMNFVTVRRR